MENSVVVFNGRKYAFNLEKIKDFCLVSDKERGGQVEVMEVQEPNDNGMLGIVSKTTHEVKGTGNPQNDSITYDLMKLFIVTLLDNEMKGTTETEMTFPIRLSFNTLLENGFLYEIK